MNAQNNQTAETIAQHVKAEYMREAAAVEMFEQYREALKKFEGKPITRRILNHLRQEFPQDRITWGADYLSYYQIVIEGDRVPKDAYRAYTLGYKNTHDEFTDAVFLEHNTPYTEAAHKRQEQRTRLLEDRDQLEALADAAKKYREAVAVFEDFESYYNPDKYSIERLLGVREEKN